MLDAGDYTMKRFSDLYGLSYLGMATNRKTAREISDKAKKYKGFQLSADHE
jgi:hypothetical protein